MEYVRGAFVVILLCAASSSIPVASAGSGQERHGEHRVQRAEIALERTVHDFGRVRHGEIVSVEFPFRNEGGQVLELVPGSDEEDRLHVRLPDHGTVPGESGSIGVTLETEELIGNVTDSVSFLTNDPDHPEVYVKVTARVLPVIAAYPPIANLGEVARGDSFTGSVPLVGILAEDDRLEGLSLEASSESLRARIAKRPSGGLAVPVLEFVLRPDAKPGNIEETITIVSEDPPARAYLRLFGKKEGDIRVIPDRLTVLVDEDGRIMDYSVIVEGDRPFRITGAQDSEDLLAITTHTLVPGTRYELVARLKALVAEGAIGVLRIRTDLEDQPLLEIPLLVGIVPSEGLPPGSSRETSP